MTSKPNPWWARQGPALLFVFCVAVLCNLPYLSSGFAADDLMFLDLLKAEPRTFTWWGGFWSIADPAATVKLEFAAFRPLWWREAGTMGTFWRPLFSLVFAGSVSLFGENALPLHALSLAAHGGVGVCLVLLVRRLTGRAGLALIAGLLYVTCDDHSLGVGWIATMTDMLCVLFIMLALLGHLDWLRTRRKKALFASLAALGLAFMSKESAVTAPITMVLLTLVAPRGESEELSWSIKELRARIVAALRDVASWLPQGAALVLYLTLYKLLGFGGMDNLMYLDPLGNPVAYLKNAVLHGPVLWLATLSSVPPSLAMLTPAAIPLLAAAGAVCFAVWLVLLWPFRRDGLAVWAFATYGVALLPQLSTDASERALYFPYIGAAILLALLLSRLRAKGPRLPRIAAWVVLLGIAVPSAIMAFVMPWSFKRSFEAIERQVGTALPHLRERKPEQVLVLNTSGMMMTFYVGGTLEHQLGEPIDLHLLSSCNGVVTLERTSETAFVIRTDRPGWLSNMFARAMRKQPQFEVGRRYDNPHFSAEVKQITEDKSDVLAVEFRLKRRSPGTLLLRWNGTELVPFDLASVPLGKPTLLADTSDVWASM